MPHYFFDTFDGERLLRDEEGSELPGASEACDEAFRLLPEIAREASPGCSRQDLAAVVRDGCGRRIARVTLSLRAEWLGHAHCPDAAAQRGARGGGQDGTAPADSLGKRSARR